MEFVKDWEAPGGHQRCCDRICAERSAEFGSGNFLAIKPKPGIDPGKIDTTAVIKNIGYSTKQ